MESKETLTGFRRTLYETVFESDTRAGKLFDVILLVSILLSVSIVLLESVPSIQQEWHDMLVVLEWIFTGIFTLEFIARLWVVLNKRSYLFSFFGIVDLLSVLPTYLGIFIPGAQSLLVIRSLRLIRIFRILKLARFVGEGQNLRRALLASQYKIIVFLTVVGTAVIVFGTIMYLVEGPAQGFTSIPISIYWAIVTMTTVGYGDISPHTPFGQFIASIIMIMGYGIIAVPTGIVSSEMMQLGKRQKITTQVCQHCLREGHDSDAIYCKYCGKEIN
ncbi:MAG: ion transporter [Cyclobacteriaceae bacterium]|jgi:voltage-gated potassium channel|nr:ion transporter [Cyclobacteriaceae bacterium]